MTAVVADMRSSFSQNRSTRKKAETGKEIRIMVWAGDFGWNGAGKEVVPDQRAELLVLNETDGGEDQPTIPRT